METAGTFVAYLAKNKELLINASDLVSFLLVTPEISKFMSGGLARRWKYVDAFWLLIWPCLAVPLSVYLFWRGETMPAVMFAGIAVFGAIFVPGMIREHRELFTQDSVPTLQRSLRKTMFALGFLLFGLSRAVGILLWAIEAP